MVGLLLLLGVGRLTIWLISIAKPTRFVWNFFDHCDLCLGMWVYTILAGVMDVHFHLVNSPWEGMLPGALFLVGDLLLTGAICTFAMHLMVLGFKEKFYAINI